MDGEEEAKVKDKGKGKGKGKTQTSMIVKRGKKEERGRGFYSTVHL